MAQLKLAFFLLGRALNLRDKIVIFSYITRNALGRKLTALKPSGEIFVSMKDVNFWFAAGRSELQPYPEIFRERIYEKDWRFKANQDDVIIDVGAHIGFYALSVARTAGKIYAFEPNSETFGRLLKNIEANGYKNIEAISAAVASGDGKVKLRISSGSSEGNTIMENGTVDLYEKEIEIDSISLDSFISDKNLAKVDILKIDTEGAEVEVLKGASKTLQETGKIVIETHSPKLREECEAILTEAGFEITHREPSGVNALGENMVIFALRK